MEQSIYQYIKSEKTAFEMIGVPVANNWEFHFIEHVTRSFLYKYGHFLQGSSDDKPNKNITLPILRLRYRTEGFDLKDIFLYVNDKSKYFLSFLVNKYHQKFAKGYEMDTAIDATTESHIDYGGALLQNTGAIVPKVIPLQQIAFCDQSNIIGNPICLAYNYTQSELEAMKEKGWGDPSNGATISIDDLIVLSKEEKTIQKGNKIIKTPGKNIEVYELHGVLPTEWLKDTEENDDKYTGQVQIIAYYKTKENGKEKEEGVTLFKAKETKQVFKLRADKNIFGRALDYGGAEELFSPQLWINYDLIAIKEMLDAASKTLYQTDDTEFTNRNNVKNAENFEVFTLNDGKSLRQVDTFPRNISLFDKSIQEWEANAQQLGAANDSIMGVQPSSGTPFKLQELVTAESHGDHDYRRGKNASFWEEVYRDWIIPNIVKEMKSGQEWFGELEADEMQAIVDSVVTNEANKYIKKRILNGELIDEQELNDIKETTRENFMKDKNKFFEILEGELKNAPIDIKINIMGKQKDMPQYVDKLRNVFQQMFSTYDPNTKTFAIFEDKRMLKLFNEIIESSGLSPIDFYQPKVNIPQLPQGVQQEIQKQTAPPVAMGAGMPESMGIGQ